VFNVFAAVSLVLLAFTIALRLLTTVAGGELSLYGHEDALLGGRHSSIWVESRHSFIMIAPSKWQGMLEWTKVHYAWPAALTSVLPAVWLRSALRDGHRRRAKLCINCGYDLRATPERCPECGTIPAKLEAKA
jgi:hypothetical protein